ncbi:SirB1 family protein [Ottowia sp.]|uniref:SirB1 family protein n=1 Tax=Ottowia sp. TaxID=1898956 RepID=UPI003A8A1215
MSLVLTVPTPLQYFAALVADDVQLPLLEAAACLAQDEHLELDVQQVLGEVDQLMARLHRRAAGVNGVMDRLQVLNQYFFTELGFAGNVNDYYHPDNSYLHRVLHTRCGIPISLAVLWLEMAQSLSLQAEGVGFPGHFLVQVRVDKGEGGGGWVVIDPFTGQSLGRSDLRARVDELHPRLKPVVDGADTDVDADALLRLFLQPASPRQMLARMLRNLQDIHRTSAHWPRLVAVQDRLIVLLPDAWAEYRERGLALARLGMSGMAKADLALYLREAGDAPDRQAISRVLAELGRAGG